ncbi:MAG: adenosylmethionine--8-amino-7-oxononanoate transaminase [Gammaproteobacteria bacterium]|nr:adenosylmethionine--8-amino-7-oxononanoate transaminase [Gammaproteobacteria bacterium]
MIDPNDTLIARDLAHHWHPAMRRQDFNLVPPLVIHSAKGSYLETAQGPVIDAISSWWCKPLGHQHPAIIQAIQTQLSLFEHVISAHTTHPPLVELVEKLASLSGLSHVLFASDGSSAVEIALKLIIHARHLEGQSHKTHFLSFKQAYHGETLATLSVSDLGRYKDPYQAFCFPTHFIDIPYTSGLNDPLSHDAATLWELTQIQLERIKDTLTAVIFEPIIQGSAGMQCYSVDFLKRLIQWAQQNGIYCIADEIMTGFCRTGAWFATQYTGETPDLICVSKGLTGGSMPLSAVLISKHIQQCFQEEPFLHSHTYSGHALAISAALATLTLLESESFNQQAHQLQKAMSDAFTWLQDNTKKLTHQRGIGGIIAADLLPGPHARMGFKLHQEALKRGVLLRPIGNTLYWFPPLNISKNTLEALTEKTYQAILATYG